MQIHLSSDKYDVIHSGQVFLFEKNKNLRLEVDTEDDLIFTIELRFYENESGDQEIRQNINENQILLSCYNFHKMGAGLKTPVEVATVKGKKLYFFFWSDLIAGESRSVSYTFFFER